MLFKVIYHKRKPYKTSETFNHVIWAAILISEIEVWSAVKGRHVILTKGPFSFVVQINYFVLK